jgi:hypothetical protein
VGCALRILLAIGCACGALTAPSTAQEPTAWLEVTEPRAERSTTSLPLLEVKGWASARERRRHDLVIVLDLSDSTVLSCGVDLDGDGLGAVTDPGFLRWLTAQPNLRGALVGRLRQVDLDDSILMAEIMAAEALIKRLDPLVFRIGIVTFSDSARIAAPLGSPRGQLLQALHEVRRGFYQELLGTNFYDAIRTAQTELGPSPTQNEEGPAFGEDRERSILFLSDGVPTLPLPAAWAPNYALVASRVAANAGIRLYSFALGQEAEEALEVYHQMASLSGGRFERITRPADAIARLRQVDLVGLEELRVVNRSNGKTARALRVFPDGSFDGFVELAEGENQLEFTATARDRGETSVIREVIRLPGSCENVGGQGAECERLRELLEELRRRTLETALWAEIESGRNFHRLEVEIQPERPRPPTR